MKHFIKRYLVFTGLVIAAFACNEDELSFSLTPAIGFETTGGTVLESNATGIRVNLYSNVVRTETVTVTIALNNFQNLDYGVDFTTEPAPVSNTITLTFEPTDDPSFFVFPTFNGEARLLGFTLTDVQGSGLELGQQASRSYLLNIKSLGCPTSATPVSVSHDFNTCTTDFATPSGFIEVFEPGSKTDRGWGCRAFGQGGSRAPRASGFGGSAGNDNAWLIMNPVSIAAGDEVDLHFWVFSNFSGPGVINVKWSSDYAGSGNPLAATWQDLPTVNAQFPDAGSQTWAEVTASFTDICGENVYLAFQFTGATNTSSASWDIDDLTFTAN